jgi:hypothetical protein
MAHGEPPGGATYSTAADHRGDIRDSSETVPTQGSAGLAKKMASSARRFPGLLDHFDPTRSYVWPAFEWTDSYAGPADAAALAAATAFDTSGFANPVAETFGWAIDTTGHTLSLTYTPSTVPEPGTLALVATAISGWLARRHVKFFI